MVDAEDTSRFPDALLEIKAIANDKYTPLLVVVNKCDSPIAEPTSAITSFFGFKKLTKRYRGLEWRFVSALTGVGCASVAKWIAAKAKELDSSKKKRKTVPCC